MDICMSGDRIEHEALMLKEYGAEVMFAEWNPRTTLANEPALALIDRHVALPYGMTDRDADVFLQWIYEYRI